MVNVYFLNECKNLCVNFKTHFSSSFLYSAENVIFASFESVSSFIVNASFPMWSSKNVRNLKHNLNGLLCIKWNNVLRNYCLKKIINQYIARISWYYQKPFFIVIFFFRCYHYVISHDICIISWWDAASIWWFTTDRLAKDIYPTTQNVITKIQIQSISLS